MEQAHHLPLLRVTEVADEVAACHRSRRLRHQARICHACQVELGGADEPQHVHWRNRWQSALDGDGLPGGQGADRRGSGLTARRHCILPLLLFLLAFGVRIAVGAFTCCPAAAGSLGRGGRLPIALGLQRSLCCARLGLVVLHRLAYKASLGLARRGSRLRLPVHLLQERRRGATAHHQLGDGAGLGHARFSVGASGAVDVGHQARDVLDDGGDLGAADEVGPCHEALVGHRLHAGHEVRHEAEEEHQHAPLVLQRQLLGGPRISHVCRVRRRPLRSPRHRHGHAVQDDVLHQRQALVRRRARGGDGRLLLQLVAALQYAAHEGHHVPPLPRHRAAGRRVQRRCALAQVHVRVGQLALGLACEARGVLRVGQQVHVAEGLEGRGDSAQVQLGRQGVGGAHHLDVVAGHGSLDLLDDGRDALQASFVQAPLALPVLQSRVGRLLAGDAQHDELALGQQERPLHRLRLGQGGQGVQGVRHLQPWHGGRHVRGGIILLGLRRTPPLLPLLPPLGVTQWGQDAQTLQAQGGAGGAGAGAVPRHVQQAPAPLLHGLLVLLLHIPAAAQVEQRPAHELHAHGQLRGLHLHLGQASTAQAVAQGHQAAPVEARPRSLGRVPILHLLCAGHGGVQRLPRQVRHEHVVEVPDALVRPVVGEQVHEGEEEAWVHHAAPGDVVQGHAAQRSHAWVRLRGLRVVPQALPRVAHGEPCTSICVALHDVDDGVAASAGSPPCKVEAVGVVRRTHAADSARTPRTSRQHGIVPGLKRFQIPVQSLQVLWDFKAVPLR